MIKIQYSLILKFILVFLFVMAVGAQAQDPTALELDVPIMIEATAEGEEFVFNYEGTEGEIIRLRIDNVDASRGLITTMVDNAENYIIPAARESRLHRILLVNGIYTITFVTEVEGVWEVIIEHPQELQLDEPVEDFIMASRQGSFIYRPEGDFGFEFNFFPAEGSITSETLVFVSRFDDDGSLNRTRRLQGTGQVGSLMRIGYISPEEDSVYLILVQMDGRQDDPASSFTIEMISPESD